MRTALPLLTLLLLVGCEPDGSLSPSLPVATAEAEPVAEPAAPPASDADAVPADHGAVVFAEHCASCHGASARGDGPLAASLDPAPVDLTGPRPAHMRGRPGGRRAVIVDGSPGTAMVGFKDILSPEDLEAVYGYVHSLRHGTPPDATDAGCAEHGDAGCDCGGGMGHGRGRGHGMGPG